MRGGRGGWGIALAAFFGLYLTVFLAVNSDVAGGSDSSGYLNAARLFSQGRVSKPAGILQTLALPSSDQDVFIPLGFRRGAGQGAMAPRYPPGLPLHMAAAAAIGGWKHAPFLVIPLSAIAPWLFSSWSHGSWASPGDSRRAESFSWRPARSSLEWPFSR